MPISPAALTNRDSVTDGSTLAELPRHLPSFARSLGRGPSETTLTFFGADIA